MSQYARFLSRMSDQRLVSEHKLYVNMVKGAHNLKQVDWLCEERARLCWKEIEFRGLRRYAELIGMVRR